MATVSERLREAMNLRGLSQAEIVTKTGIGKSSISTYLNGAYEPKQKNIYKLAKALNVNEAWLMGRNVPMERINQYEAAIKQLNKPVIETKLIPIVGTVACGNPIYAEENIQEYVSVDINDNVDFALYAQGDSMNNCKIDDGDLIYIRQKDTVENGEIALVIIDDTATIKRFYNYGDKIVLRPDSSNPKHKEQVYDKSNCNYLAIQGKVIFIKTYIN